MFGMTFFAKIFFFKLFTGGVVGALFCLLFPHLSAEMIQGKVLENLTEQTAVRFEKEDGEVFNFLRVSQGDSKIDYSGREITGKITVSEGQAWLEKIWPVLGMQGNAINTVNRTLIREAASLSRGQSLSVGDYLPDFALINQYANPVFSRDLKNRPTVISFIFSRCTVPEMCPATTRRMVDLQNEIRERKWENIRLVLISFDPDYDTPGILRQYASSYRIDGNFTYLLTGSEDTINALLRVFGVRVLEEDGTLNHTLATILSDKRGRIVSRQDGAMWSAQAILADLEKLEKPQ